MISLHIISQKSNVRQGGSGGKWQTPHYKAKMDALKGRNIEVGDVGVWVTCMRGKERQAAAELVDLCNDVRAITILIFIFIFISLKPRLFD